MANTFRGTSIEFGVTGTTLTATLLGTLKLQSREHNFNSDTDDVRDEDGKIVQRSYYNLNQEATFEYVMTGGTGTEVGTLAPASLVVPAVGSRVTAANARYTLCDGTNWFVRSSGSRGSNTTALRGVLTLEKFEGIS